MKEYVHKNKIDNVHDKKIIACVATHIIPSDEDEEPIKFDQEIKSTSENEGAHEIKTYNGNSQTNYSIRCAPNIIDFHNNEGAQKKDSQTDEFINIESKTLKLIWHYKLGHLPFSTINRMSMCGELPARLHKAHDPMCVVCQYGKATRRAW